jgi:DNA-binding Xre family transcriptional regulator
MSKKPRTMYDELMEDVEFKDMFDKSYRELVLSELLLAIMAEDKVSIRSLAKQAGISPTIIQDLRSGKRDNLTLKTFSNLLDALGYDIVLEKREKKEEFPRRVKMKNIGARRITKTHKAVPS